MSTPSIAVIIAVLNEADHIVDLLSSLPGNEDGIEIILVDGGSSDDTVAMAEARGGRVIVAPKGRASQMNAGAGAASSDILLFLHADTQLPPDFVECLRADFWPSGRAWGRFDVRLSGTAGIFRVIATLMNWRSRLTGICTGDQAMFVKRRVFERIGGFADIPLMEDIDISRRLKAISRPCCISLPVVTSSRRWEQNGIARTMLLMWWLRLRYFFGASPVSLARRYYG